MSKLTLERVCSNCESENTLQEEWFPDGRLISQCKVCGQVSTSPMLLQDVVERYSLILVNSKSGWLAGRFTDSFGDEGYLDEVDGVIDGCIESFAIAPTVAEAVQTAVKKISGNTKNRLSINPHLS